MRKNAFYFLMMTLVVGSLFTSCKKEDEDDDNNNTTTPTALSATDLINLSDAFGVLAGVKSVSTQNVAGFETTLEIGTASAVFPSAAGSTTFLEAGTVSVNGKDLTKQNNNSYVFTPSGSDVTGIDFSSGSTWNVTGTSNVPAVSNYTFGIFPGNPKVTSNTTEVSLSTGYNFTLQNAVSNADSVLFILISEGGYAAKSLPGNAISANFTASDLASLKPSSQGIIQVTPYKVRTDIFGGKKYYFINQVTVTHFANFKN